MHSPSPRAGALAVVAAAVCWGTSGTARAFGPPGLEPLPIAAARLTVAAAVAAVIAALVSPAGLTATVARGRRSLTILAALTMAAYQGFFFAAVARTGSGLASVLSVGSAPLLAGTLAFLTLGERPGARWVPATALVVAGAVLVMAPAGPTGVDRVGAALALGAGLAYSAYVVVTRQVAARGGDPFGHVAASLTGGALAVTPIALAAADVTPLLTGRGTLMAAWLGVVATAAAYALFTVGLRTVPAAAAGTLSLAEPLTATLLGVVVIGERPPPAAWMGVALLLGGLVVLTSGRGPRAAEVGAPAPAESARAYPGRRLGRALGFATVSAMVVLVGALAVMVVVAGGVGVTSYNRLQRARQGVAEAWAQVDTLLQRRHDLVASLVEVVRAAARHEKAALTAATEARAADEQAAALRDRPPPDREVAERTLTSQARRLVAVAEAYPDLRAGEPYQRLHRQLVDTEDDIAAARRYYNGRVRMHNDAVGSFPGLVLAGPLGFRPAGYFQADLDEREVRGAGDPSR